MFRVIAVLLVMTMPTTTDATNRGVEFNDLRSQLSAAKTLPGQRAVIESMREALRRGDVPAGQVGTVIYGIAQQALINDSATIAFLTELIETSATAQAATTAITAQFHGNVLSAQARDVLAEDLRIYHRQQGLSDPAINNLLRVLVPDSPRANRERVLGILTVRPPQGNRHSEFLDAVSNLLDPRIPAGERRTALDLIIGAASEGPIPRRTRSAVRRTAVIDADASIRIAAWPLVMQDAIGRQSSDATQHQALGMELSKQLTEPATKYRATLINETVTVRERAVELLNRYWHPKYHPDYIDRLIKLVEMYGSHRSLEKLVELRQTNSLTLDQMTTLSRINAEDPTAQQFLSLVTTPNLAPGSLMGPLQVIEFSDDRTEWTQATKQLLLQYPDGRVPASVAEAAYSVIARLDVYDVAAADLFVRMDAPFANPEAKALKLLDRSPRHEEQIIKVLKKLHGDVDAEFLVRRYVNDTAIEESFRLHLISALYAQVRESHQIDPDTTAAITDFARTTKSYFGISLAGTLLKESGTDVPWSIRIRQKDFRWGVLNGLGFLALLVGVPSGTYLLGLVVISGRKSGMSKTQRALGFLLWLVLSAAFFVAAMLSIVHSIGHNTMPSPDRAAPYYAATMIIAILIPLSAVALQRMRRNPNMRNSGLTDSKPAEIR